MSPVPADTLAAAPEDVAPSATPAMPATAAMPTVSATSAAPVSRTEIADALDSAFDTGPATRIELIEAARAAGCRSELVTALEELPTDTTFGHLRQLWTHLPSLPIEA